MRLSGSRTIRAVVLQATLSLVLGFGAVARAQQEPTPPGSEPSVPGEPSPPGADPSPPGADSSGSASQGEAKGDKPGELGSLSWRDIVVAQRRPILKYHRVEIVPTYNVSVNSPVIRHHGFGGILNFFLSEALNIALEATYYVPQQLNHLFLRGLNDRVLPSVNQYRWSAQFNFGYVPLYGKFAFVNRLIFQWELSIEAGIGVIQTEWLPRDPANSSATNFNAMWHLGIGWRLFLTKWLVLHAYLKDYQFLDSYEPAMRTGNNDPGVSQFVNNVVFGVGVGMFLPTSFEYKYTR
jgi:outer membrane beta-barrel protein